MSAGYPVTKIDLDNTMGRLVTQVRDSLRSCVDFKALLDDTTILTDAALTTLGYSGPEIAQIRAAFSAMAKLHDIARAAATQSPANDFWFEAKHLAGLNFH